MGADLHIHIFEGITERDLARFFSNTLGSKWFSPTTSYDEDLYIRIGDTPSVWIGEVSWLKAGLLEDSEIFIPDPVGKIHGLVGEDLPILDDELIGKILRALELPNQTGYSIADRSEVESFLQEHKGKQVFTISW